MGFQGETNPSPVTVGVGQEDGWRGVRRTQAAELDRKDRQAMNLPDPAFDDLLNRMQNVHFGREEMEGAYESGENALAGTFRYIPPPSYQESSRGVPDKFLPGRESLSVARNITVRESKRTKARTKDDDYKRRVSVSSSIGFVTADRSSTGSMQGYPTPESVPYHPPRLEPSLRSSNGTTQLDQGLEKRERRVADCTLPLSTRGLVRDDGVEQIQVERFPQQRFGQSISAHAEFGGSLSPRPVTGGGGFEHPRHLFEEGISPVFPPGGGGNPRSVVGGMPSPESDKIEIILCHEGQRVFHQVADN